MKVYNIFISKIGAIALIIVFANQLQAQDTAVYFSGQNTTWQAPPCVTEIVVECWGAGGSGGSATSSFIQSSAGGGGAGGAYVRKKITVVPGTSYNISAAGITTNNGATGGDSWFIDASTVIAKGGAGGANAAAGANGAAGAGSSAGCLGDVGFVYAGGNGATGNNSAAGGAGGGAANAGGNGGDASAGTGGAPGLIGVGLPIGGAGAIGVSSSAGGAGADYGGGGSGATATAGAAATNKGGAGGAGLVVISYGTNPTKVNSVEICLGQSATLTASGVTSFAWLPNGETTSSITVSPTSTTTYTVTGANGACSGKAIATVTIFSPVTVNSVTICPGNDVTLFAEGCQAYQWSNGATSSFIDLTNVTSTVSYTVTGTSCGISSTAVSKIQVDNCVSVAFTNSGAATWTAPACVTSVIVEVWGGGGGGGGGTDNDKSGGGGGGGGYSKSGSIPVVGGATYNMMVGAGGTAGSQSKGGNGSDSWFINTTTILAYGGTGGNSGGNVASGLGGITGVGGVIMLKGGNGGKDYSQSTNGSGGGGGGSAGPGGNGKNGVSAANGVTNAKGGTMVSGGGAGGDGCGQGGALLPDCAGSAGTAPGGGGGGGNDDGNGGKGGAGAKGKVILTYKIIPLAITANNGYVCVGTSAILTASGATTYTWTPSTGLSATNGASVTANPPSTTTYTVTGTTAGCTNSTTSVVTFTACCTQATIGLTSATGTNAQTLCRNTAIDPITYSVGGGGTNATVAGLPTGVTSAFASGTLTINGTSTQVGVFNYTVTTSGGCGPEVESGSITINDLPVITSNSATICQGQSANLTASGGVVSYMWQPGASTNASFTSSILSTSTSYTVTGKDVNGCSNTFVADVTVTPSLNITVLGNSSVCIGASNTLTAAGANTYTWAPPNFLTATTGATTTTTPTTTITYTVTGAANGCTGFTVVTIPVTPPDDASFSYSGVTFCNVTGTYTPTVAVGGNFSTTPLGALNLNTSTGAISVDAATALGKYDIIHTTTAGVCSNTYTLTVTIVGIPDATFSYAGPYCKTATVNPKITQLLGATPGVFSVSPSGLSFVNKFTGEINLVGSTANTYTVTNTIAAGGGCSLAKDSVVVTINPSPVTSVTSETICAGTTATITATGATSYTWVGGGTPSGTGNQNLTHNPASTQSYTVTGTTSGCFSSATGTITVTQAPVVGIIPPPASVCPGTPATLTATGATTYTWVGGGTSSGSKLTDSPIATTNYTVTGTIGICTATAIGKITVGSAPSILTTDATICSGSTGATLTANGGTSYSWSTIPVQTTSSINVNPTVTTTYTVTGTGLTVGCNGVAYATVNVNATPVPIISAVPSSICFGQSSILTVSAVGAASYAWSSGGLGNSITVSPATTTPYTVTVTSTAGCSATASKTVSVNPIPVVGVNSVTICSGQTASLIATGATSYAWLPNIGSTPTVTTPALTTSTSYSVTGTTAGCSSTVISKVVVITTPTVTVSSVSICAGLPATLTANGASTYIWMPGGASGFSITVNPNVTTLYTVTGKSVANCSSTGVGRVTAFPVPTAAFDDLSTINLSKANITFVDKSTNAASWTWNFGDAGTSIEQNPQHTYADTGTFVIGLRVVSNGGCVDSVFHDVRIIPDLLIYIPNAFTPDENGVNDGFSFKSSGLTANGFEFRIFNRWGEQLFYTTDITAAWKGDDTKGAACPQDIYVYSIVIKDGFGKEKKYLGNITLVR